MKNSRADNFKAWRVMTGYSACKFKKDAVMKNYDTRVVNFKDAVMNNSSTVNFEEDAVTDAAKALGVIMLTIYNYLK